MLAHEKRSSQRVLLVADDRRFRALASTLLTRRGYSVAVCARGADILQEVSDQAVDVVVLDASASLTVAARDAARLGSLRPPVGLVAVSADCHSGLAALPVVPKWSPCEALFDAIERAGAEARGSEVTSVAS